MNHPPPPHTVGVLRYAAFTDDPAGGNLAGVVLDAAALDASTMQRIATDVGYSETAFLAAVGDPAANREYHVRYFSPVAEVPFCGHATIAAAVALAERGRPGELILHAASGTIPVLTHVDADGRVVATLTSVEPLVEPIADAEVTAALHALNWSWDDLDPLLPPRVAYAGARHLVIAVRTRARLAAMDYDFDQLRDLCARHDLTTVALVWRESPLVFHARNPFPAGGVVEDAATGAAAAALGAYLRSLGSIAETARFTIHQGEDIGRPSRIEVALEQGRPEVQVTGGAVRVN